MLTRLEGALERERMLVSNASHELRTPISLMKMEIELALEQPESAPALAEALRSAAEETDRLAQLTDDLLLLARADAGELPLRRSDVPAADLLGRIATRYERRAADASRTIKVESPPGLVVRGDRRRLEQARANVVENALPTAPVRSGSKRRRATERSSCELATTAQVSRRRSSTTHSSASAAPTAAAIRTAPDSVSRSSPRSRRPTAALQPRPTAPAAEPT